MIVLLLAWISLMDFSHDQEERRLIQFIDKVEKLIHRLYPDSSHWNMPNYSPDYFEHKMPIKSPFFVDHKTDLRYYPPTGIIYDPDLKIRLDIKRGIIIDELSDKKFDFKYLPKQKKVTIGSS